MSAHCPGQSTPCPPPQPPTSLAPGDHRPPPLPSRFAHQPPNTLPMRPSLPLPSLSAHPNGALPPKGLSGSCDSLRPYSSHLPRIPRLSLRCFWLQAPSGFIMQPFTKGSRDTTLLLECKSKKAGRLIFFSLLCPQCLEERLAYSRHSINICGMNDTRIIK